jgi:hypothetical protein
VLACLLVRFIFKFLIVQELHLYITRMGGETEMLPTSHTCFNHLELPEYASEAKMQAKLELAIQNSVGFGII